MRSNHCSNLSKTLAHLAAAMALLLPRFWQPDELIRLSGIEELAEAEALGCS